MDNNIDKENEMIESKMSDENYLTELFALYVSFRFIRIMIDVLKNDKE